MLIIRKYREKGYWVKVSEKYAIGKEAKNRAGYLRSYSEHISHVKVSKEDDEFYVRFSIAKWFQEQLETCNIKL